MIDQAWAKLFAKLDLVNDEFLSRSDLNNSAQRLGWSWPEAPLLAALDLLSMSKPIAKIEFAELLLLMQNDPLGPYGDVLLRAPHFFKSGDAEHDSIPNSSTNKQTKRIKSLKIEASADPDRSKLKDLPEEMAGRGAGDQYQGLLATLKIANVNFAEAALIIIDPQRSFTEGAWMQSIGHEGKQDVIPIRFAFDKCAAFLRQYYGRVEVMFTRCPFPADSYGWARQLVDILDPDQLYFIKPGNSVLFPNTNGFQPWVGRCLDRGINMLVMAGCALNSCVRISAIETMRKFQNQNLRVLVDLTLCGARMKNYLASPEFNGRSAVASAVTQMQAAGVEVAREIKWHEPY